MSVLIVIPARYASTRYPGKPLVEIAGAGGMRKSLIRRSWEAAQAVPEETRVVVATDDDRIRSAAEAFGSEVVMTSSTCANGTERCAEVVETLDEDYEIVVNLQGDAPLTPPWFVESLISGLRAAPQFDLATPVLRCDGATLASLRRDRAEGRVGGTTAIFGAENRALYFSKEVIPHCPSGYAEGEATPVFHHVGCYAYRPDTLRAYSAWPQGPLEHLEGLEQLRFLENARPVLCVEVSAPGRVFWELNNPTDLPLIEAALASIGLE